jgi:hypothetical protein
MQISSKSLERFGINMQTDRPEFPILCYFIFSVQIMYQYRNKDHD